MSIIQRIFPLGAPPWPTLDPFLFCVHHNDKYPSADANMHPNASLRGRNLGSDFSGLDGWSMYHGTGIPGFPSHPHRGFETITLARKGYIDHFDSMGAKARFGQGDVQWMTAGSGVVHSEMFPLLNQNKPNHTELFQIWLNLPRKSKMVDPYFTMFWHEDISHFTEVDAFGNKVHLTLIAGPIVPHQCPKPPPNSWASEPNSEFAIWTIQLDAEASFTLPASAAGVNRTLYFFEGSSIQIDHLDIDVGHGISLQPDQKITIKNNALPSEILLLQGRPINEPVAKHGPFVMNTQAEIHQTIRDYQRTQFGGWPWNRRDPVHDHTKKRFAIHADGREEIAEI